jgi:TolB-like protein
MKRQGKITSIPMEGHHDLLALLNETIGGSGGSSETETLLSRIYRKWQHALPNLEEAPLFKVLGRKKEYDEGVGKTYPFTEAEKDSWANLFEYKGSHENVRLKFAIDKIGAILDDIALIYEDSLDAEAWEKFISSLKQKKTEDVASNEKTALPLPDKPSIAVLPFVNMSGHPNQEFLSDGITENITTTLSKIPELFVIAHNSAFEYKGKPIDVKKVAENLGLRYVLEGGIQKSGKRIRITAQLIDATSGHHIWSEKYDREMRDFFALSDEVTRNIQPFARLHRARRSLLGNGSS